MKRYLLVLFFSGLLCIGPSAGEIGARQVRLTDDFCELKGQVYIERNPGFADYRVYVEEVEIFADMLVYKEEVSSFATEPGYWYFTDVKGFEDFSIYLEEVPEFADFIISYTDFRASVGCK